ncbi:MAG: T9SS type A sorting domain-containing protein [candidate division Zixibacteria bacterium]|nr:T9SS type A sorting domain-containing protein [candidate division Zixibacteria bacterium]
MTSELIMIRLFVFFKPIFWLVFVFLSLPGLVAAATRTVNTSTDTHDISPGDGICGDPLFPATTCSFRAAIEESNANDSPDTILISNLVSPVRLRLGEVVIDDDSTILVGTGNPVIDGVNQPFRSVLLRLTSRRNQIVGITFQRARRHAIEINSDSNRIQDCTLLGAGIDDNAAFGVVMAGPDAHGNTLVGNAIGIRAADGVVIPNCHGVGIAGGATGNAIGGDAQSDRNYISGNSGHGLILTGEVSLNTIVGNYVGLDPSGIAGPGNGESGILIEQGAYENQVGGLRIAERNYICGNGTDGILIKDHLTSRNHVLGNSIGMDVTGYVPVGNHGCGVAIRDGATENWIGSSDSGSYNIITGNLSHGIAVFGSGTDENIIRANYIGFDSSGYGFVGNGKDFAAGIYLGPGTARTLIGGSGPYDGNYFAFNILGGVYLNGSDQNLIQGNFIGVSLYSLSSGYNGNGVVMRNGASDNVVGGSGPGEGNTISGNQMDEFPFGAGVLIADPGSDRNVVIGNKIGVDQSGSRRMPNAGAGVVICEGARHNRIGGSLPGEGNIISGNGLFSNLVTIGRGVHIEGAGTSHNVVAGNLIGVGSDSLTVIRNLGNGVGLYFGATENTIGGEEAAAGNVISGNRSHGLYLQSPDTDKNRIRFNKMFDNDSLGIALRQSAQHSLIPPLLLSFSSGSIRGSAAVPGALIDIYLADPDPSGAGEGKDWLASGLADSLGRFEIPIPSQPFGTLVTATQTDLSGATSSFSPNLPLDLLTDIDDETVLLPAAFDLEQNYPNPFNPSTTIRFSLPVSGAAKLEVYNVRGETVVTLIDTRLPAGTHTVQWDGRASNGGVVASGIYWYRLTAGDATAGMKMLLLK